MFVLENVPQIISAGDGQFINEIKIQLKDYDIQVKVLNSADFGVPQARKRAILIGSRIGRIYHPNPLMKKYVTVGEAFDGLTNKIPNQKDKSTHKEIVMKRISYIKQGENINNIPDEIRPKGGQSCSYRRLEQNKASITILNARKNMILHPIEDRVLTIRECARIQSFPDSFIFKGGLSDMYQQTANAVPPLLAETIAKEIRLYMEKLKHQVG